MKNRGFTLIEFVVVLLIIGILAAILFPVFARTRCNDRHITCQSNLKQIGLALGQYAKDYDDHLPPVALNSAPQSLPPYSNPIGWADAIHPYHRNLAIYQCPSEPGWPKVVDARRTGYTDYWFNARCAGQKTKMLVKPENIILLGEGNDGIELTDGRYSFRELPAKWEKDEKSPAFRHYERAHFLFADLSVRRLIAGRASLRAPGEMQ